MAAFWSYVFGGPEEILQKAISYLNNLSSVSAAGLNFNDYLTWLGVLDPAWQGAADAFLSSATLILTLFVVRATYRAYLSVKNGVEWW